MKHVIVIEVPDDDPEMRLHHHDEFHGLIESACTRRFGNDRFYVRTAINSDSAIEAVKKIYNAL